MTEPHTHIEGEQRRIAELLRSFDAPAPQSLHRRVDSLVAAHQDRHRAWRISPRRPSASLGLAGAALAAGLVMVAIIVGLSGGGGVQTVSFNQTAAATLRAATLPAPPESKAHHAQLTAAVDGVPFPYWGEHFGWRGTGARTDRIGARDATTVFYTDAGGQRIGYTILAGTPAPRAEGGVIAWRGGVPYRVLNENGATVVAWLRDGHLCVVSGRGVSSATLLGLASWDDHGATAS
jgi:hypothetical protein